VVIVERFSPVSLGTSAGFFSAGIFFFSASTGFFTVVFFVVYFALAISPPKIILN
jgi:hypothetical protein